MKFSLLNISLGDEVENKMNINKMKNSGGKMLKKLLLITALVALILLGCARKEVQEEVKAESFASREVKTAEARLGDISSYIEYSGKLSADETVNISPAISGKISNLLVDEGSVVKQGDLLAKLDETQLTQAKTQFNNAEKNYKRMLELKKSGAIDGATFDEVETGYNLAKISLEFLVENTHILAPIDGVVTMVYKNQGENFDAMMDPFLIRMINLSKIKAKIQVSDADINQIKQNQNVLLSVNNSDLEFTGKVTFVSPEADMMAGSFQVEITIQNKNNILRNNQFTRIKLLTATSHNAIIIPQQAVLDGDHLFIVQDGKAVRKDITLGLENEFEVEVKSGLLAGEVVVILGNIGLSDGDPVEIIK